MTGQNRNVQLGDWVTRRQKIMASDTTIHITHTVHTEADSLGTHIRLLHFCCDGYVYNKATMT